jgi:hypothetical protein
MMVPVAHEDSSVAVILTGSFAKPFNKRRTIFIVCFAVLAHTKVNVCKDSGSFK